MTNREGIFAIEIDDLLKQYLILFIFVLQGIQISGQSNPKIMSAVKSAGEITIDGVLDEAQWNLAPEATDFVQFSPEPGHAPSLQTSVRIIYDNSAIYVGAKLMDDEPEKILTELSLRDRSGNADRFGIVIDTYQDGRNAVGFFITASGVQMDIKYTGDNQDSNWDAVWESEISIADDGWYVEMRIPYSALRFSTQATQDWNIQFYREIRRYREESYWNPIDPTISGFLNQSGALEGIEDVQSPVRLSLTPFITGYLDSNPSILGGGTEWSTAYSAGMDLKWGINDAFTLDMTVIPDFGQVISDNQVLNLTPFEVFFEENRQFFTEGTEIFTKGDIFYTRRVGGNPFYPFSFSNLNPGESISDIPSTVSLYNATKISGRTNNGTGLGFFNAVEAEENATITDLSDNKRKVLTNPLTNNNVLVVDQSLRNNSYISFTNTNVMREGEATDANVTAYDLNLKTADQRWGISSIGALSQRFLSDRTSRGHNVGLQLDKLSGTWTYGAGYNQKSPEYNPNDLGFLFRANERSFSNYIGYAKFNPSEALSLYRFNLASYVGRLYDPNKFTAVELALNSFVLFKSRLAIGLNMGFTPKGRNDYFEPRTGDFSQYLAVPAGWSLFSFISSDYRKTLALDVNVTVVKLAESGRHEIGVGISPRIRFNDKFSVITRSNFRMSKNDVGFTNRGILSAVIPGLDDDQIMFGYRDRENIENTINANYIFNNKMGVTLRLRHNWDQVIYSRFGGLEEDGLLTIFSEDGMLDGGSSQFDRNFNSFNIDMEYRWRFAPGSDLSFVWKNQILSFDDDFNSGYVDNLSGLFDQNNTNSISLRMVYFLDYLSFSNNR